MAGRCHVGPFFFAPEETRERHEAGGDPKLGKVFSTLEGKGKTRKTNF
jgi:hypothetical protein